MRKLSLALYGCLLRVYPSRFLREHKDLLLQAFGDQLREARSAKQRIILWLSTFLDLIRSVPRAHFYERESFGAKLRALTAFVFWGFSTAFLMNFERHTDDSGVVVFFVLVLTFVLGCIHPRRVWIWSLAGLCVPVSDIIFRNGRASWRTAGLVALFLTAIGLTGSHMGALLGRTRN